MVSLRRIRVVVCTPFLAWLIAGCALTPASNPPSPQGTFTGVTGNGSPIVLTVADDNGGFIGRGTIDGRPFVISGAPLWRGVGTLMRADGSFTTVAADLSADRDTLTLSIPEQPMLELERGGDAVPQAPGRFTGRYQSADPDSFIFSAALMQTDQLVVGVVQGYGDPVAVTARVSDENAFRGVVTFADGSGVGITAELSEDGDSLTIEGLGRPLQFQRI